MKKFLRICLADKKNRSTFAVSNLLQGGIRSAINLMSGIFYALTPNNGIVPPCDVLMYSLPCSGLTTGKAIPSFYLSPITKLNVKYGN